MKLSAWQRLGGLCLVAATGCAGRLGPPPAAGAPAAAAAAQLKAPAGPQQKTLSAPAAATTPGAAAGCVAPSRRVMVLCERGLSFLHRGNYDRAERQAKAALRACPHLAVADLLLARVYLMRGVVEADRALLLQAKSLLETALQHDPHARLAHDLLQLFVAPPQ